ncbi:MAG: MlaD family protein [Verrucomicrobiota bacterium]|nr:MlaD family protein [Verrucomicrobiota bacterium]
MGSTRKITWKEHLLELFVGLFFFGALTILAVYTIFLSRDNIFTQCYPVDIQFNDIANLKEGDFVLFRGMRVGKVKKFLLKERYVDVTLHLDNQLKLYNGYEIEIRNTSMLGGKHIHIENGPRDNGIVPRHTPLIGTTPPDLITEASKLLQKVKETLEKQKIIENLSITIKNFRETSERINNGDGTIAKLLRNPELYDEAKEILGTTKGAIESVEKAGKSVDEAGKGVKDAADTLKFAVNEAREGKGTIGKLMNDEELYDNLNSAVSDIKDFTTKLRNNESTIAKLLTDNAAAYNSMKKMIDNAYEISEKLNNGEGTLGKLINDASLYDDAKKTINEVKGTVQDMREQAPVSTFGSFMFGAM